MRIIIGIGVLLTSLWGGMKEAHQSAEDLAKMLKNTKGQIAKQPYDSKQLLSLENQKKSFNPNVARSDVLAKRIPEIEEAKLSPSIPYDLRADDSLFKRADEATKDPYRTLNASLSVREVGATYTHKTCRESGQPYPIKVKRKLDIQVKHTPLIEKDFKVCQGHSASDWFALGWGRSAPEEYRDRYLRSLEQDKTVKKGSSSIDKGIFRYDVDISWSHYDNASTCTNSIIEHRILQKEKWEITKEEWVPENKQDYQLGRSGECRLETRDPLSGPETRIINGLAVSRECWSDLQLYYCQHPSQKGCEVLRASPSCEESSQRCITQGVYGTCALWEKTFRCKDKEGKTILSANSKDKLYCFDGSCFDASTQENQRFGEVMTKLSVFNEIKKELHQQKAYDARSVRVFTGEHFKCHKNVCENFLYDCCGSLDGFITDIGLAKCDSMEKELSVRKKAGHCRYVGQKSEKLLGCLWKSRDVHSYCCFPSKFVRVLQEQAHLQLNKGWGSADYPACGGLTMKEIELLNFDAMDLTEAYEDQLKTLKERTDVKKQFEDPEKLKKSLQIKMKNLQKRGNS